MATMVARAGGSGAWTDQIRSKGLLVGFGVLAAALLASTIGLFGLAFPPFVHAVGPRKQLAEHAVRLIELTGVEPVVLPEQGPADDRIVEASERVAASLIVTGARSLTRSRPPRDDFP